MDQGIMTLITVGLVLAAAAFVLWLLYTVIWRAVRRGMMEFADARLARVASAEPEVKVAPVAPTPTAARPHRHVQLRLPHRVPAETVPDYPPSDWF